MKDFNQQNFEEIKPWLNDLNVFERFYQDKQMIPKCKI